jgi:catechol 2,3-dioxygenase-like lactoylglutathione lyase family enzyme
MLTSARPVAFVPSTDLARSREFYESTLGLAVLHVDDFALVLRCGGVTVRVTRVGEDLRVQPFTVFGWQVDDIEQEAVALLERGVELLRVPGLPQDEHGISTAPGGARVAWFRDPDGNTLSLDHQPDQVQ